MKNTRLMEALKGLPDRERRVLVCRHGLDDREPATLAELDAELDITCEWIRQLQHNAERELRWQGARR